MSAPRSLPACVPAAPRSLPAPVRGRSRAAVPERSARGRSRGTQGPGPSGESPGGFPGQGHTEIDVQGKPATLAASSDFEHIP